MTYKRTQILKTASCLLLLLFAVSSSAQEIRYITDKLYVPIRSGHSAEYRIIHRGLPTGTRLMLGEVDEETGFTQVTMPDGKDGWIGSQYLMKQEPARVQLGKMLEREKTFSADKDSLRQKFIEMEDSYQELALQLGSTVQQLEQTTSTLNELRAISENALKLDADNRRLTEQAEILKSRMEIVEADNVRMQDSSESSAFLNGALAVLLGVIITLLVPRLWPRRRTSPGWA
jgi:SH3 domain protein